MATPTGKRDEEVASKFYPVETALKPTFDERRDALHDVLGVTVAEQTTRERDYAAIIRETGLEAHGAGALIYAAVTEAEIAEARGAEDVDVQALNEDTRRALRDTYGRKDAEDLLARGSKFVAQHPKLATMLQRRGIGSRPDVVEALVEHIRRVNFR